MKKLLFLSSFLFILSSCSKKQYCAQCYESNAEYTATDFCGDADAVDAYIDELYDTGSAAGQNWSCNKVEE